VEKSENLYNTFYVLRFLTWHSKTWKVALWILENEETYSRTR